MKPTNVKYHVVVVYDRRGYAERTVLNTRDRKKAFAECRERRKAFNKKTGTKNGRDFIFVEKSWKEGKMGCCEAIN